MPSTSSNILIWYTDLSTLEPKTIPTDDYLAILDANERARYDRIPALPQKQRYLIGRTLLKALIAERLHCLPESIQLTTSDQGRPEFAKDDPATSFNLSHTGDMIIAAISSYPIGIDIEDTRRKRSFADIAQHYFSPAEQQMIGSGASTHMKERFYMLWTLKEAFIKSKGGSIMALKPGISFDIGTDKLIKFPWDKDYSFLTFQLEKHYISSVALHGDIKDKSVIIEEVVPMVSREKKELRVLGATNA